MHGHLRGMPDQLRQIVEWIDLVQLAGVDQAHEQITHTRSIHRLIEERVFAMQDRFLQDSFGKRYCRAARLPVAKTTSVPASAAASTRWPYPARSWVLFCAPQTDSSATGADRPSPARCSTDGTSAFLPA